MTLMLRCRSATGAVPEESASLVCPSWASRSRGESTRIQLAASSTANGSPCSKWQMSRIVSVLRSVPTYEGATRVVRSRKRSTALASGGIGKIFRAGRQPLNAQGAVYYNAVKPDNLASPDWTLRLQLQFLFPK